MSYLGYPSVKLENQLLVYLRFYSNPDWRPFQALVLRWDSVERFFIKVPMRQPLSYNDFLSVDVIMLDSETTALAIIGRSGAGGRVGDIDIFLYRDGRYERSFHRPSAFAQVSVDDDYSIRITDVNWGSWDGFPVSTDFLDMATLTSTWKSRSHFVWDSHKNEFILTDETPSNFAVVNSFLKAIVDDDNRKASSFVDSEYAESISFLEIREQLKSFASEQNLTVAMASPLDLEAGYVSIGSLIESGWLEPQLTNVKRIVDFELSQFDSPKIVNIDVTILPPREVRPSVKQHVRPTMGFDKEAFERYANALGWEKTHAYVVSRYSLRQSDSPGEWTNITATLSAPSLIWAESHYAAELRFESIQSAVLNYERMVNPLIVPITVEMTSFNKLALNEDFLRFVLSTDTGQRWESEFQAEPLMGVTFLGIDVSARVIHIEFDTRENPIDWDLVQTVTLHIIRLDKLERADLSWDFGRLPGNF